MDWSLGLRERALNLTGIVGGGPLGVARSDDRNGASGGRNDGRWRVG